MDTAEKGPPRIIPAPWSLFVLVIFAAYLSTGRVGGSADNVPLRYLPLSIIREGNFDLNEFSFLYASKVALYPIQYQSGHVLPFVPVGPAVLAVPFYLVPALAGIAADSPWLPYVEKVAAASIAALSALFVLLALARLVPAGTALLAAGLYALGTVTFGVSSQSLWPVGSAQLLLALGLYVLARGLTDSRWTPYAGLPLAAAALCRPSAGLIALAGALYVLRHQRRQFVPFALLALPAVAFQLIYNAVYFDSPFLPPGYVSGGGHVLARLENFSTPLWKGLAGLMVSPAVGFLVYSPVFLFALIGFSRRCRAGDRLAPYLGAGALLVILLESKLNMWWGGTVWGPRYMVEVAPIFAYFLAFGISRSERMWRKLIFGFLAAWSVYANGLVAYAFDETWDRQAALWSWSRSPIVYYSQRSIDTLRSFGSVLIRRFRELPDSRSRSGLAAGLEVRELPLEVLPNSFLDVTVQVKNSGHTMWLHRTPDSVGTVRFGWRWFTPGEKLELIEEGRGPSLATDLSPGDQATVNARIWAPYEPGIYELELGMVSEAVAWFGPAGGPPMRVRMEVRGESLCRFDRALASMADPVEPRLHLQWVIDRTVFRSSEVLSARLNISNPGPPRVLYPQIVLRRPSGDHSFLDLGRQAFRPLCPGWIQHTWPMFLDRGYRTAELPILSLWLSGMPSGRYTLFFLYLRPKGSAMSVVATTALVFELLP